MKFTEEKFKKAFAELLVHYGFLLRFGNTISRTPDEVLVTVCRVHMADSIDFIGETADKLCSGLTDGCFESPNETLHEKYYNA